MCSFCCCFKPIASNMHDPLIVPAKAPIMPAKSVVSAPVAPVATRGVVVVVESGPRTPSTKFVIEKIDSQASSAVVLIADKVDDCWARTQSYP